MIRQILGWLIVAIIIIAVGAWLVTGGFARSLEYARTLANFGSYLSVNATSSGQEFRLPGQPDFGSFAGGTLQTDTGYTGEGAYGSYGPEYSESGVGTAPEYDPRTYGSPSPYTGRVSFVAHNSSGDIATEFLAIQASPSNTSPVSLAGWTLQSMLSGASVSLPQATEVFVQGILNTSGPAVLDPGSAAVLASSVAPSGVSFRTNRCSGYLAQFQRFTPPISTSCPTATEQGLVQRTDAQCAQYLESIPTCHFPGGPGQQNPAVPENCRSIAAEALSYNGCVSALRATPGFLLPEWRLYLALGSAIWRPSHDTVRLLDGEGRVVDVLSY